MKRCRLWIAAFLSAMLLVPAGVGGVDALNLAEADALLHGQAVTEDGITVFLSGSYDEIQKASWNDTDITPALFQDFLGFSISKNSETEIAVTFTERPEQNWLANTGIIAIYFTNGRVIEQNVKVVDYRVQVVENGFKLTVFGIDFEEVNSLQWNNSEIYGYVASNVAGFASLSSTGPGPQFEIAIHRLPSDIGLENQGNFVINYAQNLNLNIPLLFNNNSISSNEVKDKSVVRTASCPFLPIGKPTSVAPYPDCHYGSKNCGVTNYYHTGIDYSGSGVAVAAAYGRVSRVEIMPSQNNLGRGVKGPNPTDRGMGNNVIVEHTLGDCSKIYSSYSHLSSPVNVTLNSNVVLGQKVSTIGGSGYNNSGYWATHLHYEMKNGNVSGNPGVDSSMTGSGGSKCGTVNNCWGYVSKLPDSAGWRNPSNYIGKFYVYNLWRRQDPIYANSASSIINPNFDAWYKIKNNTSSTIVVDQMALSVHNSSNGFLFDLGNSSTGNPTYLYNTRLTSGATTEFPISYGGIRTPGYYKVVAKIKTGTVWHELASVNFNVQAASILPTAPSNLSATPASSSQINLSWTDSSNNETGFRIYRLNGSAWIHLTNVGEGINSYSNTGLSASTTYYYKVCSYNSAGESCNTNFVQATTLSGSGGCSSTPLAVPGTANGTLSTTDCMLSDGSYYDKYTFSATAYVTYTITLNSSAFDAYLLQQFSF